LNSRIALGAVALVICVRTILSAPNACAGPASPGAKSKLNHPINLDGFGAPLPAVMRSIPDLATFAAGQLNFRQIQTVPQLGPLFNGTSCIGCHSQPAMGGDSPLVNEVRVRNNPDSRPVQSFTVDNMLRNGPQSQGGTPIFPTGLQAEPLGCQTTAPGCQLSACQQEEALHTTFNTDLPTCDPSSANFAGGGNCVVGRSALPLFGDGLVEAVADETLVQLAQNEPQSVQAWSRWSLKTSSALHTSGASDGRTITRSSAASPATRR